MDQQADKRIRLDQQFGAAYFELAALTHASAETCRAIAPCVKDNALHVDGEVIELKAENTRRVTTAVARVRWELPAKTASSQPPSERSATHRRIAAAVDVLTAELASIPLGSS